MLMNAPLPCLGLLLFVTLLWRFAEISIAYERCYRHGALDRASNKRCVLNMGG